MKNLGKFYKSQNPVRPVLLLVTLLAIALVVKWREMARKRVPAHIPHFSL